jgi:glycosyltransferase involved in cell wall biosynthesis
MADFLEIKDDIPFVIRQSLAWIFRWLEPFLARMQSGLIFADDQIAETFRHVHCPKVTLFNFPVDSFFETASHTAYSPESHQPIVLYLGGLKRNRGTTLMLDAFKCVLEVVPQAKLILVGPFAPVSLEAEMRSSIAMRLMSNSVTITGAVPFDQVDKYLAQASIGWIPFPPVPKYQKNIPTKLFEYMAYSIPVVSSDLYPVRIFIENNQTGLLVPADDPSAHAKAIITLLTNPSFASSLGKNGQKKASEQYRWSVMEKRLHSFYADLLNK